MARRVTFKNYHRTIIKMILPFEKNIARMSIAARNKLALNVKRALIAQDSSGIEDAYVRYKTDLYKAVSNTTLASYIVLGNVVREQITRLAKATDDTFLRGAREFAEQRGHFIENSVGSQHIEAVRSALQEALIDGTHPREIAKVITGIIGTAIPKERISVLASTEAHGAATSGQHAVVESYGGDFLKEWLASPDSRTRTTHASANGQRREMDEPFHVGTARLKHPGDHAGPPEEVIQCRCAALYHPKDFL